MSLSIPVTQVEPYEVQEVETRQPATAPEQTPVERVPLGDVLRQIGRDAEKDPAAYLAQTAVPKGGE